MQLLSSWILCMGFLSSEYKEFKTNFTLELKGMFLAKAVQAVLGQTPGLWCSWRNTNSCREGYSSDPFASMLSRQPCTRSGSGFDKWPLSLNGNIKSLSELWLNWAFAWLLWRESNLSVPFPPSLSVSVKILTWFSCQKKTFEKYTLLSCVPTSVKYGLWLVPVYGAQ